MVTIYKVNYMCIHTFKYYDLVISSKMDFWDMLDFIKNRYPNYDMIVFNIIKEIKC